MIDADLSDEILSTNGTKRFRSTKLDMEVFRWNLYRIVEENAPDDRQAVFLPSGREGNRASPQAAALRRSAEEESPITDPETYDELMEEEAEKAKLLELVEARIWE